MFKYILLASHGTDGAVAAEDWALKVCARYGIIDHLIVIPEFWRDMTGDDWLNNGTTRDQFREYLQTELKQETEQQCERIKKKITHYGLTCNTIILFGRPDQMLLQQSKTSAYDLVVIGSSRPKDCKGKHHLRTTMLTQKAIHDISAPIWIAPYPV